MQGDPTPAGAGVDRSITTGSELDVLRIIACGGADAGKSTLIGRLLYESGHLPDDQLATLQDKSGKSGGTAGEIDFSLLVDRLRAEYAPGDTVDVAFRNFATVRREFIVADTPGHEQYTRNLATGASTAELCVMLIDAGKGVLTETRRHSYIVSLLGITHVVLAVNKMDLVDYSRDAYDAIVTEYRGFAEQLEFAEILPIPVSALKGDNISAPRGMMPWYRGPTLIEHLERVDIGPRPTDVPFRMPVQVVNRTDPEVPGYSGTVAGGGVKPGDVVVMAPSGRTSRVTGIATVDGDLDQAVAGQGVTLTLADAIDVGRGEVMGPVGAGPEVSDQFRVHMLWMSEEPMLPGRSYALKIGAQTAQATVSDLRYIINVKTHERTAAKFLALDDIAVCNISLDRAVAYDPSAENRETGSFVLIDRSSGNTVAVGIIDFGLRRADNLAWQALQIDKAAHSRIKNQKPCVLWFTGLSGSGKSTIADLVEKRLHSLGKHTLILDGDNVRHGLNRDLGFTEADRVENIRRVGEVSKLFVDAGLIVLVSFISPFESERQMARKLMAPDEFLEIFVDTPLEICEQRDPKGLYKKARAGQVANFTGIDSPYEIPTDSEISVATANASADDLAEQVIQALGDRGII